MKKNYTFQSLQQVLDCFRINPSLTPSEIAEMLGKSRAIVHRYLWHLVEVGTLKKIGTIPNVHYSIADAHNQELSISPTFTANIGITSYRDRMMLDQYFLKFSPRWERWGGYIGFEKWCQERWVESPKKVEQYGKIAGYIDSLRDDCGLIEATHVFDENFEKKIFSHVYYADQYTWMDFGRGKLAELTFYAKLTQNKRLLDETIEAILPKLECLISREKIDAIAITPWSIERKNQLLQILSKKLKPLWIPQIKLVKYYRDGISIPQKSLKSRAERVQNARETIYIDANLEWIQKILLIDDFVGSGATLYETAQKLHARGVENIVGFAWVGNTNLSYEVINEI